MGLFFIPVQSTFYFFNRVLDVYMSVERLTIFIIRIKLNKLSWKITCFLILAFCLLINTPHIFIFKPKIVKVVLNAREIYSVTIWVKTNFAETLFGKSVLYLINSIRDIATLGLELFLNVLLIVLVKRHFNRKKSSEFYVRIRKDFSRTDRNMIFMVAITSLLSAFQHLFFFACTSFLIEVKPSSYYSICYASLLMQSLKHSSNFFVFFIFNKLFRKAFKKLINSVRCMREPYGRYEFN